MKNFLNNRILLIAAIVILSLCVRLYYDAGPVYQLGDEGIYLNILSQAIILHSHQSFSMYANANFSDPLQGIFNPANIFKFYAGFIYPEVLFLKVAGYSAANVIYYVMMNSLVEAVFLFLILELVAGRRAAAIGSLLLALLPLDVVLSVRVVPVIPMVALLMIAFYLFLRKEKSTSRKSRRSLSFFAGAFVGLAYLVHPEGIILLPVLVLYSVFKGLRNRKDLLPEAESLGLVLLGAFVAFSITGTFYFINSGNFFLYPQVDHNAFLYQSATQNHGNFTIGQAAILSYTTGTPYNYVSILLRTGLTAGIFSVEHNFFYFSILGYLAIAFGIFLAVSPEGKRERLFACMFVLYLVALSVLPTSISRNQQGELVFLMVNSDAIYSSIMILPIVAIVAIGIDRLISSGNRGLRIFAVILIVGCVAVSIMQLNYDSTMYRNSMQTVNDFVRYVSLHSGATFYAQPSFAQEALDISGYKYDIRPLFDCNNPGLVKQSHGYLALGGTISMTWAPGILQSYDDCVKGNLTGMAVVYLAPNPYEPNSPFEILGTNST